MYDAWAVYDDVARPYLHHEDATAADIDAARNEAISYAAYNVILHRFVTGPAGVGPGRAATVVEGDGRPLKRIAWCTGGAQGYFEAAIAAGADAFVTGEISEPQAHYARETGVAFLACGHHASERFGAPAVAAQLAQQFALEHEFIDIDNPA